MRTLCIGILLLGCVQQSLGDRADDLGIDFVTITHPGNTADPRGYYEPEKRRLGSVPYEYQISTHEITNAQYTAFLNAVDPFGVNEHGFYPALPAGNGQDYTSVVGTQIFIRLNASAPEGKVYRVILGRDEHPVTYITNYMVRAFANWLHSGDPLAGAYNSLKDVFYITDGLGNDICSLLGSCSGRTVSPRRQLTARFWIPTIDEWYKAAYFDPETQEYANYPTGRIISSNRANIGDIDRGFTPVGSYDPSASGTYDQAGNANEIVDAPSGPTQVGGFFGSPVQEFTPKGNENFAYKNRRYRGFRIARVTDDPAVPDLPELVVEPAVMIRFEAAAGHAYKIEHSTGGETWEAVSAVTGEGKAVSIFQSGRGLYRVRKDSGE